MRNMWANGKLLWSGAEIRAVARHAMHAAPLVLALWSLTSCGSSSSSPASKSTTGAPTSSSDHGAIHVVYDPPTNRTNAEAQQILHLGGTDGVAAGFAKRFQLPADIAIHAVNAFVGPDWNPTSNTITLSYPFVDYIARILQANFPELRKNEVELGKALAAIDGFVLIHEFGHAFIHLFNLPVLGKEEDAADSLAGVFYTTFVRNGDEYAFDAASFFHALSARQRKLAPSDYWDQHSLDAQRADSIVCWIAGSSHAGYKAIASRGILGANRLRTCPAEYAQKVQSWGELLRPHLRAS